MRHRIHKILAIWFLYLIKSFTINIFNRVLRNFTPRLAPLCPSVGWSLFTFFELIAPTQML